MIVSWSTYATPSEAPQLRYGTSMTSLTSAVSAMTTTYNTSVTYHHHVTLTGLTAAAQYFYTVTDMTTPPLSFTTAIAAGDPTPYAAAIFR